MTKTGFHWRDVQKSTPLKNLDQLLRDADGPMTGMEIQEEARRRGFYVLNPGTSVGELGRNPGYKTSGGVRFPDGQYRYWLIEAPNWRSPWRFIPQTDDKTGKMVAYKIIRGSFQEHTSPDASSPDTKRPEVPAVRACSFPGCTNPVPPDRAAEGYMTCSDLCYHSWRAMQQKKLNQHKSSNNDPTPAQGGLF